MLPLGDGRAIKLTTARYFTPRGRSIQANGIQPDILIGRAEIRQLDPGFTIKESNLSGHLSKTSRAEALAQNKNETNLTDDNQIYEAINLLKGLSILQQPD